MAIVMVTVAFLAAAPSATGARYKSIWGPVSEFATYEELGAGI
jgi:hypothetical protein